MGSGITKHNLGTKKFYGLIEFDQLKPEKVITDSSKFSQMYRASTVLSNVAAPAVPNETNYTGFITYTDGRGATTITGFFLPIPNVLLGGTVHIDRLTINLMFGHEDSNVNRIRLLRIGPVGGVLNTLYDNIGVKNIASDPSGILVYEPDCDIPADETPFLEMYINIAAGGDFEIYSFQVEYSLV